MSAQRSCITGPTGRVVLVSVSALAIVASLAGVPLSAQHASNGDSLDEVDNVIVRELNDGRTEFIRPSGERQVRDQDGTVTTYFPDGRIAIKRPNGDVEWTRQPSPDGGRRPRTVSPGYQDATEPSSRDSTGSASRQRRDDPRRHAEWQNFERELRSSGALPSGDSPAGSQAGGSQTGDGGGTITYISEQVLDDGVVARVRPDGTTDFSYPDGSRATRSPDGTTVFKTDDGRTSIQYPGQQPQWAKDLPNGGVQYPTPDGKGTVSKVPGLGTVVGLPDGTQSLITNSGVQVTQTADGRKRVLDQSGQVILRQIPTDSGETLVIDAENNAVLLGPAGNVLDTKKLLPGEQPLDYVDIRDGNPKIATTTDQTSTQSSATPPPDNIFAIAKRMYDTFEKNPEAFSKKREALQDFRNRVQQIDPASPERQRLNQQLQNEVNRFRREVNQVKAWQNYRDLAYNVPEVGEDVQASGQEANPQSQAELFGLAQQRAELQDQGQELQQQRTLLDELRSQFNETKNQLREERLALAQQSVDLSNQRDALRREWSQLNLDSIVNNSREARLDMQLRSAANRVDFSLYDRCPNGHAYDDCDHEEEKSAWWRDQLNRLVGPGYWDDWNGMKDEKDRLETEKQKLERKNQQLSAAASDLRQDNSQLLTNENALSRQGKQIQSRVRQYESGAQQYKSKYDKVKSELERYAR